MSDMPRWRVNVDTQPDGTTHYVCWALNRSAAVRRVVRATGIDRNLIRSIDPLTDLGKSN